MPLLFEYGINKYSHGMAQLCYEVAEVYIEFPSVSAILKVMSLIMSEILP